MSLTVESCMELPAFRHAKIMAGRGGIRQSVNSITVLEYSDVSVISSDLFLNHEMCITAFSMIRDDVEAQCAIIRKMKEIGICALVLYYVGIFVPYLDDKLLQTADEVDLPLICTPFNRFDFRYSEAINDVMYAIFRSREKELNFIPEVLESISQMPEQVQTLRNVLQLVSDRFYCSFFLLGQDGNLVSEGQWPCSAGWDFRRIAELIGQRDSSGEPLCQHPFLLDGKDVFITHSMVLPAHNPQLHLFAVDEQRTVTVDQVARIAELLALFMNIYNYSLEDTTPEMIIRSLVLNERLRIRELASKHSIDLTKLQRMWVLRSRDWIGNKRLMAKTLSDVQYFFQNRDKRVLTDLYQNSIIMLFQGAFFAEFEAEMENDLMEHLAADGGLPRLIKCNLKSTQDVQDAYQLIDTYFDTAQLIFPRKEVFDLYDLHFAERLKALSDCGENGLSQQLYALQPLRQSGNYRTLLETLTVYLLDAGRSASRTAELLDVHKNTVRYRMKQIRESYVCDIAQMPLASELYEAVALQRLLRVD